MNFNYLKTALLFLPLLMGCSQEVRIVNVETRSIKLTQKTQSKKIEAEAQDIHENALPGIDLTYRAENPRVATVDAGGVVKPVGNGSTIVVVSAPNGTEGEATVIVCFPKEIICDPEDEIKLRVGVATLIKCQVTDCKDQKIAGAEVALNILDPSLLVKQSEDLYVAVAPGDTEVKATAFDFDKRIPIHIAEKAPEPSAGSGGKGSGKGKSGDPYGSGGQYDHIIKNMKISVD